MVLGIRLVLNPGCFAITTTDGRTYRHDPLMDGFIVDIPFPDADTIQPDQATKLMVVGTTADRPVNEPGRNNWPPLTMFDTTRQQPIFLVPGSNPATWVNIWGGAV
jgi:hypothetical protein